MKVLLIRFSSIGDIVLTTPVIRCLKQQVPGVQVHYLTKAQYGNILVPNPYIDRLITVDDSLSTTIESIKQEKYDYIIDLHHNLRTWKVKRALSSPAASFNKLNIEKWLLVNFKIDRLPGVHIIDRYLATAKHLGVKNDGNGMDFFIEESTTLDKSAWPEAFRQNYVAFAIGGQHITKQLPAEKIVQVCLNAHVPVVLLGGKEDEESGQQIVEMAAGADVLNLCGKLSVHQSALLIKSAKALATHDTGMMHIGAALDRVIFSIWGNTVPKFGMYPYFKNDSEAGAKSRIFEINELPCRPCSKIGFNKCPKGHFKCMNLQDTDAIAAAMAEAFHS